MKSSVGFAWCLAILLPGLVLWHSAHAAQGEYSIYIAATSSTAALMHSFYGTK